LNLKEVENWLRVTARTAADQWWIEQNKNIYAHFYLYFKPGEVTIAEESPGNEWQLGSPERIGGYHTREQVRYFILDTLRKLPCLPVE